MKQGKKQYTSRVLVFFAVLIFSINNVQGWTSTQGPIGGRGGKPFDILLGPASHIYSLTQISLRAGERIDGINLTWHSSSGDIQFGKWQGGTGGMPHVFNLVPGEYLTEVRGRYGARIDSVVFVTNQGRTSRKYGGNGGDHDFRFVVPMGYEIIGLTGRAGNEIDALGIVYRKRF